MYPQSSSHALTSTLISSTSNSKLSETTPTHDKIEEILFLLDSFGVSNATNFLVQ